MFLATAVATRRERYVALAIASFFLLAFIAIAPFAGVPLAKVPAFIPSYETALFFIDLITAALLFDQFIRFRSIGLLALACGYLFDALIIVPHALTFPGAFAPEGLFGAGPQTTAWLYVFWHGVFPLFVMAYAVLRRSERGGNPRPAGRTRWAVAGAVVGVAALAAALSLIAVSGHDLLPVLIRGGDYSLAVTKGITPAVWALTLLALISLWRRQPRVIDLWLMLVMWIWLFDIALSAVIGTSRFDLGWYAGRIFGSIAASFLLIALLIEMARMHAGALGAAARAEKRLDELAHPRAYSDDPQPPRKGTEAFIQRQNIANYRSLLESGQRDDAQRRAIETLLSEEEAKPGPSPRRD